jgi:hypothetical protein
MRKLALAFVCSLALASTSAAQEQSPAFKRPPIVGLPTPNTICMTDDELVRVRPILLAALDEALKNQIMHLFETWMRDIKDQPDRARQGASNAVDAYLRARHDLASWKPKPCN